MLPVEISDFPVLRGEEAIEVLHEFVCMLEQRRGLTTEQVDALRKLAEGAASYIEQEMQNKMLERQQNCFTAKFRGLLKKLTVYPKRSETVEKRAFFQPRPT